MSERLPTVAVWVRRALRTALRRDPVSSERRKIEAVRATLRYSFPTPDIQEMLSQIESSYLGKCGL